MSATLSLLQYWHWILLDVLSSFSRCPVFWSPMISWFGMSCHLLLWNVDLSLSFVLQVSFPTTFAIQNNFVFFHGFVTNVESRIESERDIPISSVEIPLRWLLNKILSFSLQFNMIGHYMILTQTFLSDIIEPIEKSRQYELEVGLWRSQAISEVSEK